MKTIREMYEEKQVEELEESFVGAIHGAATVLGYSGLAGIAGFGAAVIVSGAKRIKLGTKIKNFFKKISGRDIDYKKGADRLRNKSGVKEVYDSYKKSETAEKLSETLEAVSERDYVKAIREFRSSGVSNSPEALRVLSLAVAEEFGEPPLYYISPGNEAFQFLKRIVGPRTAKAVSDSVIYALNKNKSYFTDFEITPQGEDK